MNKKPLRPCKICLCPNLTRDIYCPEHKYRQADKDLERYKNYNKYKRDKRLTDFYNSRAWKKAREEALARDDGLCQECLKDKSITVADTVHHIVEIKEDWSKRLDLSNLTSVCHSCHSKIHGRA